MTKAIKKSIYPAGLFLALFSQLANADLATLKNFSTKDFLQGTAPTGCQPKGMKASDNTLYVAEMCGKKDPLARKRVPTASIYDLRNHALIKTIITPIGANPGILANTEVDFSLDQKWAFIARAEGDKKSEIYQNYGLVTVVNSSTREIAKYIPVNGKGAKIIATRPLIVNDAKRKQLVYIANYFSDDISVLDVTDLTEDGNLDGSKHFLGRIKLNTNFRNPRSKAYFIAPRGVAFTPDGKYGIILATETGTLIIVDAVKHRQLAEIAPIAESTAGRKVNVRHIVISKDGETAYLSHMHGNAISRISIRKLIDTIEALPKTGPNTIVTENVWNDLFIPFNTETGKKNIMVLEDYPKDHPNFPGKKWDLAHPNTIVLDPIDNRYLYVSHRTTSNRDYRVIDNKIKGKIDIIDTYEGKLIFSLVGGAQPTALEISPDGRTLISGGFKDDRLYFYDIEKLLRIYEQQ